MIGVPVGDSTRWNMATKPAAKAKASAAPGKKSAPAAKQAAPKKGAAPARKVASKEPPKTHTLKAVFEQLAEAQEMPKKQAQAMAGGMVDLMTTLLKNGDRITGLGILEVKDRPARTGRNPATGASIQIAASKKVAFRVAKELKEAV
jgi:DNA-binding protein HU-beta